MPTWEKQIPAHLVEAGMLYTDEDKLRRFGGGSYNPQEGGYTDYSLRRWAVKEDPLTESWPQSEEEARARSYARQATMQRILDAGKEFVPPDAAALPVNTLPAEMPYQTTRQLALLEYGLPEGYFGSERHRREEAMSQRAGTPLTEEVKIARMMMGLAQASPDKDSTNMRAPSSTFYQRYAAHQSGAKTAPNFYQDEDSAFQALLDYYLR